MPTKNDPDISRALVEQVEGLFLRELGESYIFFAYHLDGTFFYVSPSMEQLLGENIEDTIGRRWRDLPFIADSIKIGEEAEATLLSGLELEPFELALIDASGAPRIYEMTMGLVHNESGENVGFFGVAKDVTQRKAEEVRREELIAELRQALDEIKSLRGILPLCSFCKKIRNDQGYWEQVDSYIANHLQTDISHSICPECVKIHYPELE